MARIAGWLLVVGLVGCAAPADGDPRDDGEVDADGDGLLDAEERDLGTDPTLFDTDGDTYGDGLEVEEGRDPLDRRDRFYEGFWPYNPDKDALPDAGFDGRPLEVGDRFGRIVGTDQYGEQVDLYDFAGTDGYVIIDASATWCVSCRKTSSWLAGGPDDYEFEYFYADVRVALADRRVHWVSFLTDNGSGPADEGDVEAWHNQYPNRNVAVLTDQDEQVLYGLNWGETYSGVPYAYFPSFAVVDADMNIVARGFVWDALDYIAANLEP
jgi:hypothetical protein